MRGEVTLDGYFNYSLRHSALFPPSDAIENRQKTVRRIRGPAWKVAPAFRGSRVQVPPDPLSSDDLANNWHARYVIHT